MTKIQDLRNLAHTIKTETKVGGNTADRVGSAFEGVADALEGTEQIAEMDKAVQEVQQQVEASKAQIQSLVNALPVVQQTGDSTTSVMSQKAVSDAIQAEIDRATEAEQDIIYDVSARNGGAVFESLSALLSSSNLSTLIPTSVRHGGMSIRFIQGSVPNSDNNYVQYRLRKNTWSTNINYWENIKRLLDQRTNLFDEKSTNIGWIYVLSNGQVSKVANAGYNQTAPIKVNEGEIISIYNVTPNTDHFFITRLNSDDIDDVLDGEIVNPTSSIDGGSYYEYKVHKEIEYISVGYLSDRDIWIYSNVRKSVENLFASQKEIAQKLDEVNLFDKGKAYYGWIYWWNGSQAVKGFKSNFAQTYPIKVSTGDVINIYNVTPNKDSYSIIWLGSDDIEDTIGGALISPFKSIDGGSFVRYVVPSNVPYITCGLLKDRRDNVKIYRSIKVSNNSFVEINALGDSITEGYIKTVDGSAVWANPTWCQSVANNLGCKVNNYGVSATSVCDGSKEAFVTRLNRMTESWIDCLVIFGGTNDYGDKRALTLGTIADEPEQGTNFYASFKNLVLTAIKKYPMAQILVITPMRRQSGSQNQYGISIEDIVNAEIEIARYYGVKCFDFFHEGGINPAINEQRITYTSDGLHPNQDGINRFLAPLFTMEIEKLIACRG